MRNATECPCCRSTALSQIHNLRIDDKYNTPEKVLNRTNSYQRNYILFEEILKRSVDHVDASFMQCQKCGFIFFTPRPDDSDLKIKYDRIVESDESVRREQAFRLVDQRNFRAREIQKRLAPFMSSDPTAVLDVGGADGHCIALYTTARRHILDFETRETYPGVERVGSTMDDLEQVPTYDLAMTCHTLEHIDLVNDYISQLHRLIKKDGLLYIEVPLGCNGEIKTVRNLLTHLNFFSSGSLGALLERNGFRVESARAAPVMSRKRYLPVVYAVARKAESTGEYTRTAVERTKAENTPTVDKQVMWANVGLVAKNPIGYGTAFLRRSIAAR